MYSRIIPRLDKPEDYGEAVRLQQLCSSESDDTLHVAERFLYFKAVGLVIGLKLTAVAHTLVYPGDPQPRILSQATIAHDGYAVSELTFGAH